MKRIVAILISLICVVLSFLSCQNGVREDKIYEMERRLSMEGDSRVVDLKIVYNSVQGNQYSYDVEEYYTNLDKPFSKSVVVVFDDDDVIVSREVVRDDFTDGVKEVFDGLIDIIKDHQE